MSFNEVVLRDRCGGNSRPGKNGRERKARPKTGIKKETCERKKAGTVQMMYNDSGGQ